MLGGKYNLANVSRQTDASKCATIIFVIDD